MTVIENVRKWLESEGYSLEMQAASAFRAAGFEVRQSTYYTDPETKKPREIDVEAIEHNLRGFIDVRLFVECKSGNKPWVLLCSPDTLSGYNRVFAFAAMSSGAKEVFNSIEKFEELLDKYPWLKKEGVIAAYSLRQAFNKDVDTAYAAAMSVAKACQYHIVAADRTAYGALYVAFPIIVIDTPLIRCSLDAAGQVELQEVEQGEFLFTGHPVRTCIRIVTLPYLHTFAKEAKQVTEQLKKDFKDKEEELFDAMLHGPKRRISLDPEDNS